MKLQIDIPVEKQRIHVPLKPLFHAGTRESVVLHFEFDKLWKKYTKKAIGFYTDPEAIPEWYPIGNDCVSVPDEFADMSFYIQIVGQWGSSRMTTALAKVRVDR